jgi:hypothetical protein
MSEFVGRLDKALTNSSALQELLKREWKSNPSGDSLVSPDDAVIDVRHDGKLRYRGVNAGVYYTDADYAQLLRFESDPKVQKTWCIRCSELLKFASEAVQLAGVQKNGNTIYFIKNPSEAVQLAAVRQNGPAIRFIQDPSEAVKLAAVKHEGWAIRRIQDPSEEVKLAAVQNNGEAIYYIKNPSEDLQLAAVRQNGLAIRYIENPSEAVQLAAVEQNGLAIHHIESQSRAVKPPQIAIEN